MKYILNGREVQAVETTAYKVRQQYGKPTDIIILNGFQLDEDCPIEQDDMLNIITKGEMPQKEELESMLMARHTPGVHSKIKSGKVAIAGLGGLGSNVAVMLARIGVGQLLLVDFDMVEPSNLNRQSYNICHLGQLKTLALKTQLEAINPFITIETRNVRVTESNVKELFEGYDIICEAFDRPEAKAVLVNTVLRELNTARLVAASGMAGYDSSNLIKTVQPMQRLYVCGDLENGAGVGNGLMAPRVMICAGHQANMVLRLLVGEDQA